MVAAPVASDQPEKEGEEEKLQRFRSHLPQLHQGKRQTLLSETRSSAKGNCGAVALCIPIM